MSADTATAPKDDAPEQDAPKADKQPKRSTGSRGTSSSSKRKRSSSGSRSSGGRRKVLKQPLTDLFTHLGMLVMLADQYDGQVIIENAERMAKELDTIAKRNASVQRTLERVVSTSEWGSVLGVFGAVALPIAARHGLVPQMMPALVGATPPDEVRPLGGKRKGDDADQSEQPASDVAVPSMTDLRAAMDAAERTTAATSDA